MKNKQKLIEIINDLESDNFFNNDTENSRNITLSIEALKKELDITQAELQQETR